MRHACMVVDPDYRAVVQYSIVDYFTCGGVTLGKFKFVG